MRFLLYSETLSGKVCQTDREREREREREKEGGRGRERGERERGCQTSYFILFMSSPSVVNQ